MTEDTATQWKKPYALWYVDILVTFLGQDLNKVCWQYVPTVYRDYRSQGFGKFLSACMAVGGWE